jgi:hypothetical protein
MSKRMAHPRRYRGVRTRWTSLALGVAGVWAAGCSPSTPASSLGDTTPNRPVDSGGDSPPLSSMDGAPSDNTGSADGASTDAASADATATDSAGMLSPTDATAPATDGGSSDAGQLGADGGPPPAPRCDPTHVWTSTLRIPSVPQATFSRFGGVSFDELTIAWTSATGAIYVADRAARGGAFAAPSTVDTSSTPVAADRAALSATGMGIFAVAAGRTTFLAFNRARAGAAWSASVSPQFANLSAMAAGELGGQFSDPALGADGVTFFYVLASSTSAPVLYESKWDAPSGSWTTGVALANPAFASPNATSTTYATGASSDGRTLFFYDGTTGQERAAWRDTVSSPFAQFVNLAGISEAAPNFRCDTLYFQGTDADSGGAGVLIAQ